MMKKRALLVFTVSHAGIKINVRVLPHIKDVDMEFTGLSKSRLRAGMPRAFFQPSSSKKIVGTIVLAGNDDLYEIVPHEVVHAVLHRKGTVHSVDDEAAATAIGLLTSRIIKKIKRRVAI